MTAAVQALALFAHYLHAMQNSIFGAKRMSPTLSDPTTPAWPYRATTFIGLACTGKSTLGEHVAKFLGLHVVHLDHLRWSDGWTKVDNACFVAALAKALKSHDRCIVEGSTIRCASSLLPRLGLLVFLDLKLHVLLWRALRRSLTRIWTRKILWNGNRETFRQLFGKDSLIVKLLTRWRSYRSFVMQAIRSLPHVHLRSSHEIQQWLVDHHFPPLTQFEALP